MLIFSQSWQPYLGYAHNNQVDLHNLLIPGSTNNDFDTGILYFRRFQNKYETGIISDKATAI